MIRSYTSISSSPVFCFRSAKLYFSIKYEFKIYIKHIIQFFISAKSVHSDDEDDGKLSILLLLILLIYLPNTMAYPAE